MDELTRVASSTGPRHAERLSPPHCRPHKWLLAQLHDPRSLVPPRRSRQAAAAPRDTPPSAGQGKTTMTTFDFPMKMATLIVPARAHVAAEHGPHIAKVLAEIDQCRAAQAWNATGLLAAGLAATLLRARLRGMPEMAYQSRFAERDPKTHRETKIAAWQLRSLHEVAHDLYLIDADPDAFALAHNCANPLTTEAADPSGQRRAEAALGLLTAIVRDMAANKRAEFSAFRSSAS